MTLHDSNRARRATLGWCAATLMLGALCAPCPAWAHDPGLSSVDIFRDARGLVVRAVFAAVDVAALADVDADGDGTLGVEELERGRRSLQRLAAGMFVIDAGGAPASSPIVRELRPDDSGAIHFVVAFEDVGARAVVVRSLRLADLGLGHRQFVRAHHGAGAAVFEGLLDAEDSALRLPPYDGDTGGSAARALGLLVDFVVLGVEHILIGYDHIAFLIALLIVGGTLAEAARTITAFTAAHSITLVLAALDLVRLPVGAVEAAIALSIVYVGIENLRGKGAESRWRIAFAFGLIHGFGFASVLGELTAETGGRLIVPLVGFNLGVEIGQVAIAMVVLPVVARLREHPAFVARYAPASSLLITAAGLAWFVERTGLLF